MRYLRYQICMVIVGLMLALAPRAEAGLMGSTLDWQYYAYGGPYTWGTSNAGSFTVTGGVGGTFDDGAYSYFNIIATDTQIIFDYSSYTGALNTWSSSSQSLSSGGLSIYNGILIQSAANLFTSATIDPSTNMAGFSASNITWNAGNIAIDWANISFDSNTRVVLNVASSSAVPEPSTILLLGSGFIGLAAMRRFRKG